VKASRVILHADMDAFYASIEQRDRPELRGRPVIVGGLSERGVVSAASYEARVYGVHSAMATAEARRLCPDGVYLRGDLPRYRRASRLLFEIFARFTPRVEGLSLDEAFLDLTGTRRLLGPPAEVGARLRRTVRDELGLGVSVGIAPNKMVAKIASEVAKPDGLLEIRPEDVMAFLDSLPVGRVWGVGPVAEQRLRRAGFATIGALARADPDRLRRLLGAFGLDVARLARGEDVRDVEPERPPVSYSEENTFEVDVRDRARLQATLLEHAESVARRLRRDGLQARTVVLKVKLGRRRRPGRAGHSVLTRRATLPEATDDGDLLACEVRALLSSIPDEPIRLLGVGVTNLVGCEVAQLPLFQHADEQQQRQQLNRALDEIVERFGPRAVVRAGQAHVSRAGLSFQIKRGEDEEGD
jgi:DNA polymerase-4